MNIIKIKPEKRIRDSIARMSLDAIGIFEKEKLRGKRESQAYAIALNDVLEDNLQIFKISSSFDRGMLLSIKDNHEKFLSHHIRAAFMRLGEEIYKSGLFHHQEYSNGYENFIDIEIAIFKGKD